MDQLEWEGKAGYRFGVVLSSRLVDFLYVMNSLPLASVPQRNHLRSCYHQEESAHAYSIRGRNARVDEGRGLLNEAQLIKCSLSRSLLQAGLGRDIIKAKSSSLRYLVESEGNETERKMITHFEFLRFS